MTKFFSFFVDDKEKGSSKLKKSVNLIIAIGLLLGLFILSLGDYKMQWSSLSSYGNKLFDGYKMTLIITFFAMIISLLLGFIIAFLNNSKILIVHYLSKV